MPCEADVQVGGTDQLFNILTAARKVMASLGARPNIAIILGILPGTDGVVKMSKSLGNHIPDLDHARGYVRQNDEHSRFCHARVLPAGHALDAIPDCPVRAGDPDGPAASTRCQDAPGLRNHALLFMVKRRRYRPRQSLSNSSSATKSPPAFQNFSWYLRCRCWTYW